ncbi:hypothetical protein VPH35_128794 [Triticum aestivum]
MPWIRSPPPGPRCPAKSSCAPLCITLPSSLRPLHRARLDLVVRVDLLLPLPHASTTPASSPSAKPAAVGGDQFIVSFLNAINRGLFGCFGSRQDPLGFQQVA